MNSVTRYLRAGLALATLSVLGWLGGCSDNPVEPTCCDPPQGLIVSDPVSAAGVAAGAAAAPTLTGSVGNEGVYVSLPPSTIPTGNTAAIRRAGDAGSIFTTVRDGGFDPIQVNALAGDSIDVLVWDAANRIVLQTRLAVAAARPPIVVRTNPARKKRDVPLNSAIVVVFSEPVAEGTLTSSSVQLSQGTTPVAGTVSLLQGTGTAVAFTPTAALDRNTEYRLIVTPTVRDLDGDALAAGDTVVFTTGESSTGPAASIIVTPDTVFMTATTYQLTATVQDSAGNMLIDQPVTWATTDLSGLDPSGLIVSATGLLTGLAEGYYYVRASVGALQALAEVIVRAGPAASVTVSPTQASVGAAGDTISLTAAVRDVTGRLLDHPSVTWTSSDVALAKVAADSSVGRAFATVTGVRLGSVTITARSGTASGTASVTVTPPLPVASVTVTPAAATLVVQGRKQLSAVVQDANGKVLAGRPIAWTTDNAAVATVGANGLAVGIGVGSAAVSATSEGVSDTAAITVTAISLVAVDPGGNHACGLTLSGAVYCWGLYGFGALGVDSLGLELCRPAGYGGAYACSTTPIPAADGLTFSSLRAGGNHTCGVMASGKAYCWGYGGYGDLGDGSTTSTSDPAAVSGGLTFAALSAGVYHTCGLNTSGAAYCWGMNEAGELGASTGPCNPPLTGYTPCSSTPVAVSGGLTFSSISVGQQHTCGLTPSGAAYCWGENGAGQLGDGSTINNSPMPVLVSGGRTFSALSAGGGHTCALTSDGAAYCWGDGQYDQLGASTPQGRSRVPVPVSTPLRFSAVSAGGWHTCGLTANGAAYCWGYNEQGQLGASTGPCNPPDLTACMSTTPVAVSGGLTFSAIAAMSGGVFTCGVAMSGAVYCWGHNAFGQLGNGTTTNSNVPVKVAGQP